jgi:HTH-type transcriptional regulator / antitoxin HigA
MDIKPMRDEADYERALRRVEELWGSKDGSAESDELDIVTTLIEAYKRGHYPINLPDPIN